MAEVVDSIIVQLEARLGDYAENFAAATRRVDAHTAAMKRAAEQDAALSAALSRPKRVSQDAATEEQAVERSTRGRKKGASEQATADEQGAERSRRATRARTAEEVAAIEEVKTAAHAKRLAAETDAAAEARAVVAAEREKAAAAKVSAAEQVAAAREAAALEARLDASSARRVIVDRAVAPAQAGAVGGRSGSRAEAAEQSAIMAETRVAGAGAAGEVAAEREVNHLLADQADLRVRLAAAAGADKIAVREKLSALLYENQLRRAGIADEEIALRLDERAALVAAKNAEGQRLQSLKSVGRFGEAAGIGRTGGSLPAVAGIITAAAVGGGIEAVKTGIDYAKEIADTAAAVGVSTKALQVYQAAAREVGVTNEQLRSGFGQLNSYLGKAKEGDEQAAKTFKALGINIASAASAGDILPTLIARISSISDPARRAAVETRLFGEEGRRLDALLSGGNAKVDALAASLERAGSVLSDRDIATLKAADEQLGRLKQQLEVDLSHVVANNANAILSLAGAFAKLADDALRAVGAVLRFRNQNVIANPLASPEDKAAARESLLSSHEGRQYLFDDVQGRIQAAQRRLPGTLPNGDRYLSGKIVNGQPQTVNQAEAATRDQVLAPLLAERRQILLRNLADRRQSQTPPTQDGKVDQFALDKLYAPKPPKGRKGKSAEELQAEAEARQKRYLDQLAGLQETSLRAEANSTASIERRAAIEVDLANRALAKQLADYASEHRTNVLKGADEKTEAAREATLAAAARAATAAQVANINQQRQAELIAATNEHLQTRLRIEAESLSVEASLATTARDRRTIALRELDNERERERANLTAQRDALKPGDARRVDLQNQIDAIDPLYDKKRQEVIRSTENRGQTYARGLNEFDKKDFISDEEVKTLDAFNSGLDQTISKTLHLHGILGQIVGDLVDMLIKQALLKPIANQLFGGGATSGGGVGGFLGSLLGVFGHGGGGSGIDIGGSLGITASANVADLPTNLPGFATGGGGELGGNPGVDQNVLSLNGNPIARVGRGELLSVSPTKIVPNNTQLQPAGGGVTVIAPQQYDLTGVVMTEDLVNGLRADNRAYSNKVAAAYSGQALAAAPARVRQVQTLKG